MPGIPLETLLLLLALIAAWLWLDSIAAREIAIAAGRQVAERYGLQFLDDTVAFNKLRTGRDRDGRLRLRRTYQFEVSDTGTERLACSVTLLGKRIEHIEVPPHRDYNLY